jgi:hypothetical protein
MCIIIDIKSEVQAELGRQDQLDMTLREIAQFSHKIPLLRD